VPAVSAIVCTHDRPAYLAKCLDGLAHQTASQAFETIVVDSASPPAGRAAIAELAARHGASLVVAERAGLSLARNLGAAAARGTWLAYIDDDAVADPGWIAAIIAAGASHPNAVALGGMVRPAYEADLPGWWPPEHVGSLTVITHPDSGEVGADLPRGVEPYGANFIIRRDSLSAVGGFPEGLGRVGTKLLSNEESLVLRQLRNRGGTVRYEPAIAVTHSIQAGRLTAAWLLQRLYWQGVSNAVLQRMLGERGRMLAETPRRLAAMLLYSPLLLLPAGSGRLFRPRGKAAYSAGYLRGLFSAR
jgi:GT2 family glycosyltransferase